MHTLPAPQVSGSHAGLGPQKQPPSGPQVSDPGPQLPHADPAAPQAVGPNGVTQALF